MECNTDLFGPGDDLANAKTGHTPDGLETKKEVDSTEEGSADAADGNIEDVETFFETILADRNLPDVLANVDIEDNDIGNIDDDDNESVSTASDDITPFQESATNNPPEANASAQNISSSKSGETNECVSPKCFDREERA